SQKTGIEIPINARIMRSGSRIVPRKTAAAVPARIAKTTQISAAPITSESVTGVALVISGITFVWLPYEIRSRVMNIRFIISAYRTGSGRSSPNSCLMFLIVSGFGFRPAISRAGSTPGVSKKIRKTSADSTNMTTISPMVRRMANVSTGCFASFHADLRARVEGVAQAVAEDVQREHCQDDHYARGDRDHRPRVEQVLAVLDDRPPARLRRLDADREVGECRLRQDGRRDHQRQQHDHRRKHVREDLAEDQPGGAGALGDRGLDE